MTLLPSPELAKAITAVVMDHAERSIERTRTISSAGLEEAILSRLLFLNATAAQPNAADAEVRRCAAAFLHIISLDPKIRDVSPATGEAAVALSQALRK